MRMALFQIMFMTPVALILAPVILYVIYLCDSSKSKRGSLYPVIGIALEVIIIICAIIGFNNSAKINQIKQNITLKSDTVYNANDFINEDNISDVKVVNVEWESGIGTYEISNGSNTFILHGEGNVNVVFRGAFYDVNTRTGEYKVER